MVRNFNTLRLFIDSNENIGLIRSDLTRVEIWAKQEASFWKRTPDLVVKAKGAYDDDFTIIYRATWPYNEQTTSAACEVVNSLIEAVGG